MSARDEVLAAVRAALGAGDGSARLDAVAGHGGTGGGATGRGTASGVDGDQGGPGGTAAADGTASPQVAGRVVDRGAVLDLFAERVADHQAEVTRCSAADLGTVVSSTLAGAHRVVVPAGLGVDVPLAVVDDGLTHAELDAVEAVVTAAAVGIAQTGTVVLDHGPDQGRRAITLLPDLHVCLVRESQVVADVADALALLDPTRPQTWVSGPSATSDIELSRVEGVHGPRRLHVVLLAD